MDRIQKLLLNQHSRTFNSYYNGKMSYALKGKDWDEYIADNFVDISSMHTSENIFKTVVDLYAENLIPNPKELHGFSNTVVPLLTRGEAPVIVDNTGMVFFPEHYEMISDGDYTAVAVFTRSIKEMQDYVTFIDSDGVSSVWSKPVPDDLSVMPRSKHSFKEYKFIETTYGNVLIRFALDDKGMGESLASLQDRINHSIIDQTIVAEMYARPFWYLLNTELPVANPYLPKTPVPEPMKEQSTNGGAGRIFTTSSPGPFGQLTPPTISDMITYHDSLIDKVSQTTGIPQHYFKPGTGAPPTGIALKVMSKRFNNKIARIRDNITPNLENLCEEIGVLPVTSNSPTDKYGLWTASDDLLQDSLDAHGLALAQMGYPLDYIAEVVTPGVDLDDYTGDYSPNDYKFMSGS